MTETPDLKILEDGLQIDPSTLNRNILKHVALIDIRDPLTVAQEPLDFLEHIHVPIDRFASGIPPEIPKDKPALISCWHGVSSIQVTQYLRGEGYTQSYSVIGGYEGLRRLARSGHFA